MTPDKIDLEVEDYKANVSLKARNIAKQFMVHLKDDHEEVKKMYLNESSATCYYFGKLFSEYVAMYAAHYIDIHEDKPVALKEAIERFSKATLFLETQAFSYSLVCLENNLIKHVPELTYRNFQTVSLNVDIKHALLSQLKQCKNENISHQAIIEQKVHELHNALIKKLDCSTKPGHLGGFK
jgi:hypothetical protein